MHLQIQPTRPKIFFKYPESAKGHDLNLPHTSNYLHSIHIVLSIIKYSRDDLKYTKGCLSWVLKSLI